MKFGTWGYLGGFIFLFILSMVVVVQNLGIPAKISFLWLKEMGASKVMLLLSLLGLLQGICLTFFLRLFFSSINRSQLSKFDLDKPL